jgi:phosphatidylglycerophosphatase A
MNQPSPSPPKTKMNSAAPSPAPTGKKPRISLAIATAFGLGYLPKAPGTFGSLAGIALTALPFWFMQLGIFFGGGGKMIFYSVFDASHSLHFQCWLTVGIAVLGVWSAHRAAKYWNTKDPQKVVIDEVSGQYLTLILGSLGPFYLFPASNFWKNVHAIRPIRLPIQPLWASMWIPSNWKYLLLGFILFRVFDIWKPFPARQAESLPGGLGIMADDWVAGIYAALGLWIALALGF